MSCHIALNCKSCSSTYVPGIGQTATSWSLRIFGYSRWESSRIASFWVVHLSLIKSFRWSPSLPFALPSQRQKLVKLFSSRSDHSSRRAASLGWSEGLGQCQARIYRNRESTIYIFVNKDPIFFLLPPHRKSIVTPIWLALGSEDAAHLLHPITEHVSWPFEKPFVVNVPHNQDNQSKCIWQYLYRGISSWLPSPLAPSWCETNKSTFQVNWKLAGTQQDANQIALPYHMTQNFHSYVGTIRIDS